MKPSEDLYHLIHSLNTGERWRFKVYTAKSLGDDKKNYLKLFEAIAAQPVYDEAALRKKFRKETFVRQFSVAKHYLYHIILDSLSANADDTPARQLRQLVQRIDLLNEKGLHSQAEKLLKKAQQKASYHQLLLPSLELQYWEYSIATDLLPRARQQEAADRLLHHSRELAQKYMRGQEYAWLLRQLLHYMNTLGLPGSKADQTKADELNSHPLLQDESHCTTLRDKIAFHIFKAQYGRATGNMEMAYGHYRQVLELQQQHAKQLHYHTQSFHTEVRVSHIFNFLLIANSLRRYDDFFEQQLQELKALYYLSTSDAALSSDARARIFLDYYTILLRRHLVTADLDAGLALIPDIEKDLKQNTRSNNDTVVELLYAIGLLLFYAGRFEQAMQWFSRAISMPQAAGRPLAVAWIQFSRIIIYFELGNERMLEYSIRSAYRYLLRHHKLRPPERLLLRFFRSELPRVKDEKGLQRAFKKLYAALQKLKMSSSLSETLESDALLYWLQSRLEGRPLREIIKR